MKFILFLIISMAMRCSAQYIQHRTVVLLDKDWKFLNSEVEKGSSVTINDSLWQAVTIPHDWAISGNFDENIDVIIDTVLLDGEKVQRRRTGETGGLPHIGVGWYRKSLDIPIAWKSKNIAIEFDGAMSHAQIFLNEKFIGEWPYGYASFSFDLTDRLNFGGENILAVRLENKEHSSRWYPGAGIYRNVRLVITDPIHIKQWGTCISTPNIAEGKGNVNITTTVLSSGKEMITLQTDILNSDGELVATKCNQIEVNGESAINQLVHVENFDLWSVGNPILYKAISKVIKKGELLDYFETTFGFRHFEFTANNGFFLNGENIKINGVCLHHDLGPIGAAVNKSAIKRQLTLLKEMGCNAIRTSHNPPAPELLQLTDEMGFLVFNEAFDEWKYGKTKNGYHTLWEEWAEKDLTAFIHRDRNHPSVIAWSVGNEIREQDTKDGAQICQFLVDICKREDPTRSTTAGFNSLASAKKNGLADVVDIPGWNYKPQYYKYFHDHHPHWKMYASETVSTVSSRGEYFFPVEERIYCTREPYHSSSYDMEFPRWGCSPDTEFAAQDSFPFIGGEFVWTGFDYLGEPIPYDEQWPSRSSYFGIIDLCGIPKDRFYLYQSKWSNKEVLHLLPHWNWSGKEGEIIPVHCYTNFEKAELFLNGKSLGIKAKDPKQKYNKYRLVWDTPYEPGELKVVALDRDNQPVKMAVMKTAGEPFQIILEAWQNKIKADGKELAFITVSIVDDNGVLCPHASNQINFTVEGEGTLRAVGNGDPTNLESFVNPTHKAFNGKCVVYVQSTKNEGDIIISVQSYGLKGSKIIINTIN